MEEIEKLRGRELAELVRRVFTLRPEDRALGVLVDLPDGRRPDHPAWAVRREMAASWVAELRPLAGELGLEEVLLMLYRQVGSNNADLPPRAWLLEPDRPLPSQIGELAEEDSIPFEELFSRCPLLLAPTELSATAPLKIAAPKFGFRAATMPGFSAAMIPALRLDYTEIARRVDLLKGLLDRAVSARICFELTGPAGGPLPAEARLHLDLRHRLAHASGGLLPRPGTAGNLPSGEAYIVPYEGEQPGDPSRTSGLMPVELDGELVAYGVEQNRAIEVLGEGPVAARERQLLAAEPARGNLAELGLGVLDELGVKPCGELLLDEKLGLHLAFGRSEHFGGQVGPAAFSDPGAVVHIDRVYLESLQPRVKVRSLHLDLEDGQELLLMSEGRYTLDWRKQAE